MAVVDTALRTEQRNRLDGRKRDVISVIFDFSGDKGDE